MRPPIRSRASITSTRRPALESSRAAVRPAAPAPMITTSGEEFIKIGYQWQANPRAAIHLMSDPDQLEQLKSCTEPAFREFYQIYAASIAAREQKSEAWICEMVRKPDTKVLVTKRGGHVKGFSILFLPRSQSFGLLE